MGPLPGLRHPRNTAGSPQRDGLPLGVASAGDIPPIAPSHHGAGFIRDRVEKEALLGVNLVRPSKASFLWSWQGERSFSGNWNLSLASCFTGGEPHAVLSRWPFWLPSTEVPKACLPSACSWPPLRSFALLWCPPDGPRETASPCSASVSLWSLSAPVVFGYFSSLRNKDVTIYFCQELKRGNCTRVCARSILLPAPQ